MPGKKTETSLISIEKKFGKIITRGNPAKNQKYDPEKYLSSGSYRLNKIISGHHRYSLLRGRIAEFFGPEGSGKTTLALHHAADCTHKKMRVAFIDMERSLDLFYAEDGIGIDMDYFDTFTPYGCEGAFELTWELLKLKGKERYDLLIYDSVTSMKPQSELDGKMTDNNMGLHARKMNQGITKAVDLYAAGLGRWVIFINQERSKIGVFFGDPNETTGGRALKFYSSYRLKIQANRKDKIEQTVKKRKVITLEDEEDKEKAQSEKVEVGVGMTVFTFKNKLHNPKKKITVDILYGDGIDKVKDTLKFLEEMGIVSLTELKSGKIKSVTYGKRKPVSPTGFRKLMKDPDFKAEIKEKIEEKLNA